MFLRMVYGRGWWQAVKNLNEITILSWWQRKTNREIFNEILLFFQV
jgi:hypothetical protein